MDKPVIKTVLRKTKGRFPKWYATVDGKHVGSFFAQSVALKVAEGYAKLKERP